MGDPMALDQAKNILASGRVRQHDFGAVQEITLQSGTGKRQIVRQRQHAQQNLVRSYSGYRRRHFGIINIIVMRSGDELGNAGRAARELEDCRIFGIDCYFVQLIAPSVCWAAREVQSTTKSPLGASPKIIPKRRVLLAARMRRTRSL